MSLRSIILSALVVANEATSVKFEVYPTAKCMGTAVVTTYQVATATGGACYDNGASSTKNQWCDEAANKFHQEFYQGGTCAGTVAQQDYTLDTCSSGTGAADPDGYVKVSCTFTPAAPCFGRDTDAVLASGETVPMISLRSGDVVQDGPDSFARIIVNQHKTAAHLTSPLLTLEHEQGSVSLTPDHVLNVDGSFVAAREAMVGSKLGNSKVSVVTRTSGGIINPLTTSGKIIADGVLASTYPEWIAGYMLGRSTYSVSNLLSYLFPATTQAYYDTYLEQFFQASSPTLVNLMATLPAPLIALTFVVADLLVAAGFAAFSLSSLKSLVTLVALGVALKTRK